MLADSVLAPSFKFLVNNIISFVTMSPVERIRFTLVKYNRWLSATLCLHSLLIHLNKTVLFSFILVAITDHCNRVVAALVCVRHRLLPFISSDEHTIFLRVIHPSYHLFTYFTIKTGFSALPYFFYHLLILSLSTCLPSWNLPTALGSDHTS